jgi:hypothetical protein
MLPAAEKSQPVQRDAARKKCPAKIAGHFEI